MQRDQLLAGRYRLLERLGSGGMSAVYRAYDEVLERDVAVKVLVASDPSARQRIRAEAKAAARLSHPHVTNVYDFGESRLDGVQVPFVVLELLNGDTLESRLVAGPLPPRAALRVCAEVASAISAAHGQGLVHRDVKPGNVMLTPTGAKVLDFGIAAAAGDSEIDFDGRLLGTPAYLAPERLAAGEVLPASDVYALGLLLHRTLTGRLPWAAETQTGMLRAHVHVDPDPLPEIDRVPAEIHRLYHWCLARNPDDRPPAAEVARILLTVVSGLAGGNAASGLAAASGSSAASGLAAASGSAADSGSSAANRSVAADRSSAANRSSAADRSSAANRSSAADRSAAADRAVAAGSPAAHPAKDGDAGPNEARKAAAGGDAEVADGVNRAASEAPRRQAWRRRRVALVVGGAVIAAVAVAGSLGDYGARRHDGTTPRTGIGTGGTTTVGLPETVAQPEPSTVRAPAEPSAGPTSAAPRPGPAVGPGRPSAPGQPPPTVAPTVAPTGASPPAESPGLPVRAQGGTVTVRCVGGLAELLTVTPASGYQVPPYDAGPAKQVTVELTAPEHSSEIRVHCAAGRPKAKVTERAA
ncbi:protein kinase [Micromonospora sp. NPDC049801]|uniref:serine/threonine-protein kinase n=1 Tax=unclassified Micromonospora TaxID=2617518 RepID=UPI0033D54B11